MVVLTAVVAVDNVEDMMDGGELGLRVDEDL